MTDDATERQMLAVLKRLSRRGGRIVRGPGGRWRMEGRGAAKSTIEAAVVSLLQTCGFLAVEGPGLVLTDLGKAALRRSLLEPGSGTEREHETVTLTDEEGSRQVTVNTRESPLAWLRKRRDQKGKPMIDPAEFAAGERLRTDYTRGQLMPRITANWNAAVAGRGRDSGAGAAEITEVALAARRRVEKAIAAVGPELGGLLVDFCCFLKGLEEIERERRWPARSAKVALRLGLSALARHYGLGSEARGRQRPTATVHWGTEDYRPTLD